MIIKEGDRFPNLFLIRPDGSNLDLDELRKKEHALLLFLEAADKDLLAFIQRFQDETKLFQWLQARLIVVFREQKSIPTPWPAPGYSPFVYSTPLPEGLDWGQGYLVSKNRSVFSIYPELPFLSASKVEDDLLHWEAGHCMQ